MTLTNDHYEILMNKEKADLGLIIKQEKIENA